MITGSLFNRILAQFSTVIYIRQALLKLKEDIRNDIIYLRNLDSLYSEWYVQASDMQKSLLAKSKKHFQSIDEYYVGRGSMNQLSIRTTTFNEMINTGLMYKINHPTTSHRINEYYEFAKTEIDKVNLDNQEFYRYVLNTSGFRYVNLLTRVQRKENLEFIDWSWLQNPKSERYMIFESRLSFHKIAIEANRELIEELLGKANTVLLSID